MSRTCSGRLGGSARFRPASRAEASASAPDAGLAARPGSARATGRPTGRRRRIAVAVGLVALVLPATAAAHGRSAIIALDYRLSLDRATVTMPGVRVRVLDGDRDFEVSVAPGVSLLVRGELREPFLRIGAGGAWVNASSPTATSDGLVSPRLRGWIRVSDADSIVWHDHRLAPPPRARAGPDGGFSIPVVLNGRPAAIAGRFFRVARPSLAPWLAGAAGLVAAIGLAARSRARRPRLAIGLGLGGGLAALAAVTTFAARGAPSGGVAWLQIGTGLTLALVLGGALLRLRGRSRVHAAGVIGAVAAAVSLSSMPVFWHGVLISALPAPLTRLLCGLALLCGSAAAALSFLRGPDPPLRAARR